MRIALFVTCLVDLMRPSIGFAAIDLLEAAGCEVVVPPGQTCCGQPAYSAGDQAGAVALAKKTIADLESGLADYAAVVLPSGSCAAHMIRAYPELLAAEPAWRERAEALAGKTCELTDFLSRQGAMALPGAFSGSITYHDSCSGLRQLGIKQQPRALLAQLPGLHLKEMPDCEACCGFGGSFALKFGDISTAIVDKKCHNAQSTGADAIVGGDLGCLMNIEGRLRRLGDQTPVLHVAEVLAGQQGQMADAMADELPAGPAGAA